MEQKRIKIVIKLSEGKTLPLEVSPQDTIGSIQAKIKEAEGIAIEDQQIGVNIDKPKDPSSVCYLPYQTIEELNLSDDSEILCYRRSGGLQIKIKFGDETFPLDSDVRDSIYHVKELIASQKGIPAEKQRILFCRKNTREPQKTSGLLCSERFDAVSCCQRLEQQNK